MQILEISGLKKSFAERQILDIDTFRLYSGDRYGLVGLNGAGKTTLLEILAGSIQADEGFYKIHGSFEYIKQLDDSGPSHKSGGEKTLDRIARAFSHGVHLLMADEPTSNLSIKRVEELKERLISFDGGLIIISHDRDFLNSVCNKIIEIENGRMILYNGNYDFYRAEKSSGESKRWEAYERYAKESARLEERIDAIKVKAGKMKKAPRRMGNSEARLHKNTIKEKAKKVSQAVKGLETRAEHLERVDKPIIQARTKIDIQEGTRLHSKNALEVKGATKAFGDRILFKDVCFKIVNGSKTVMIGENGTGKTTLLNMIVSGDDSVNCAKGLKVAYFAQDLSILDEEKTIYDNVAAESKMSQTEIRNILSRMLFVREDVFKPVGVLSGGERVKVALCKIFCNDVNMLILDEPNNYLDIYGMEALEGLIADYGGTILIVSHDRSLIDLADNLIIVERSGVRPFNGSYAEYTAKKTESTAVPDDNTILMLENRIAMLIGQLAEKGRSKEDIAELDAEFIRLSRELRSLKSLRE